MNTWLYVGGGALLLSALVAGLWPQIQSIFKSTTGLTLGPLSEKDLETINKLRLQIAAIARKAQDAGLRQTVLDLVHQMEGAIKDSTEPPKAVDGGLASAGLAFEPRVYADPRLPDTIIAHQEQQIAFLKGQLAVLQAAPAAPGAGPGGSVASEAQVLPGNAPQANTAAPAASTGQVAPAATGSAPWPAAGGAGGPRV